MPARKLPAFAAMLALLVVTTLAHAESDKTTEPCFMPIAWRLLT